MEVSWLSTPNDAEISYPSPTRYDVARVLKMLGSTSTLPGSQRQRSALPPEISLYIINLAEYWPSVRVHRVAERRIPKYIGELLYLSTPGLPAGYETKRVEIKTVSWAQIHPEHSSFEIALMKARWLDTRPKTMLGGPEAQTIVEEDDEAWDPAPDLQTGYNLFEADELVNMDKDQQRATVFGPRHVFLRNQVQHICQTGGGEPWDIKTTTLECASVPALISAMAGMQLGVFVRTEAPGWVQFVREVDCTMYIGWP
jgi:hypothetical protein